MISIENDCGFFKQNHYNFRSLLSESQINNFASLISDRERFLFVHQFSSVYSYDIQLSDGGKSETVVKLLKDDGNRAFKSGRYKDALVFYSKCIVKAPQETINDKEAVAVILANRSAALYHLEKHQLALLDIESAFTFGYPRNLAYKIQDRKARCLLALNQHVAAVEAFRLTLTALDNSKLLPEQRQKWQKDVQIMLAVMGKNKQIKNEQLAGDPVLPSLSGGRDSKYRAACSAVAIKEAVGVMGRYAEARRDIRPGETLLTEPAYCAVLLAEYASTHCFNCFKRAISPQACPRCCNVLFCSLPCQRAALDTHHSYECRLLPYLWASSASVTCLMALRLFTQSSANHFKAIQHQIEQLDQFKHSCAENGNSHGDHNYMQVHNLVRHETQRSAEDFLHRAHMAVFLFRCLHAVGFFAQSDGAVRSLEAGQKFSDQEAFVGGLLLHHLQLLQFNAHEVSALQQEHKDSSLDTARSVFLGGALYPTLALFNHSCHPGIVRYFHGTSVVVRAIRNTRKGEMIAENYGPIFTQTSRGERQTTLRSHYWFDCDCIACSEDWPMYNDMDTSMMRFRCASSVQCSNIIAVPTDTMQFMALCEACNQHTNILKGLKMLQDTDAMFRVARSLQNSGDVRKALYKFIEILILLDETLAPPFKDYHLCQQAIRTCFLALGNRYIKE